MLHGKSTSIKRWHGFDDAAVVDAGARRRRAVVRYEKTHTFYEGRRPACGRCDACAERIASFRDNGVCDPLEYEVDIAW